MTQDRMTLLGSRDAGPSEAELEWVRSGDTGISSQTIWSVMTGVPWTNSSRPNAPYDPNDFGRCHRLLEKFPAWRERLDEVAKKHPIWAPFVAEWPRLTRLYVHAVKDDNEQAANELYAGLRWLRRVAENR